MAVSAARHKKPKFGRPQPPNSIILAHTAFMLRVSKDMDRAIYSMLRAEGLFRADAIEEKLEVASRGVNQDCNGCGGDGSVDRVSCSRCGGSGLYSDEVRIKHDTVRADAAERDLESLERQMKRRLAKLTGRKDLVGAIDDLGLRAQRYTRTEWQRQLQGAMGVNLTADPDLGPMLESFRKRQGDLITSLAQDKIARVKRILRKAGANARVEDITKLIREQTGATQSRAALIARTETTTLTSKMTQARHQAAGIHSYTVSTSQDERVRESHRALEGQKFEYGKPPIVDGLPFVPGQTFCCRCVALPVLPGEDDG